MTPATVTGAPVALVTGASRGIGRATALALAAGGAHCILTARTPGGLEETDDLIERRTGRRATLLPLDLRDGDAIDTLGPSIAARFGRLDVLVHCAAMLGVLTPVTHMRDADWTATLAVNATAAWRMIRTTAPLLERAPAGRAVFLTDGHATHPASFWGMMAASKAAMEAVVLTWADEIAPGSPLRVNLYDPGPVATRLRVQAMPAADLSALPRPDAAGAAIAALCRPDETRHGQRIRAS
ncbi:short-chain dehydrogenase/reductase SDR [Gluconacetobacter diazotrophicus PA1 5]|uniref:SDR family NAD(P)-dependent oxidoreductase n=2 Tax=Gluconacetobacter diazotrophicus TaxID=33996 RepID=A0A7W4I8D5_GLUDI|nr:SDR family NAD(P)-dependent oxidoreductase [Gluconacetobacter diazotrophicus]ACI52608.1 short-chain dehydrogenase/reductase SDR [Gluconacetobacter diazotrophicus PA1 5]MBB2158138.1 SDR family NAD(P)-dependent oxidoreductase [Gluconacetobacter diazotrophicus]TWB06015.1 NAD(P)-dependent dehydrogenase (short-subunit alcohol dehydrogenase family) [Gluconacetobacter diazotrophicus]CAP57449.1 putative short-chain dehydrogenase/reductase protein [Gluconacetobacter diazotrophicus PA1 5]